MCNDHRDCWVFKQELPKHTHIHKQIPAGTQEASAQQEPSREVYVSQVCHWPACSLQVSPVSSLAPIITTSLCLFYTLHPLLPCSTQITLSIRIGPIVCVSVCDWKGACVSKGQGRSESPVSPSYFPVDFADPSRAERSGLEVRKETT